MFYKIISVLVDYIVKKNDIFAPKSPKLGNTRKKFCLKPIPTNHTNKKYTIFPHVCVLKFLPLLGRFPALS